MQRKYETEISEMRNLGYSFDKIGRKLGISRQYAHNVFANSKGFTDKQVDLIYSVKYPNIREWLLRNKIKVTDLCKMCGECKSTGSAMCKFLMGQSGGSIEIIKKILDVTNMRFEKAFEVSFDEEK